MAKLSLKEMIDILRIEREAIAYDNRLIASRRKLVTQNDLANEVLRQFNETHSL